MQDYTYLFLAEDHEERPQVFHAQNAALVSVGDILEKDGELFVIQDLTHLPIDSPEYAIIEKLCGCIYDADAIYHKAWTAKLPI